MDTLEQQVKDFIAEQQMPAPPARLIVGVSGGADSLATLAVLSALGYDCVAAHCNFHLRGEESDRDRRHVMEVTKALNIDVCVKDFDVNARCAATGESLEMACRELRYAWFAELIDTIGAVSVAIGHHREDSVETFFINLLRGSGIGGLCGISPRNGIVMRPLLACSRADIEAYLRRRGIAWVNDSTNAENDFLRNRLRNSILPLLEEAKPGAGDAVLRTCAFLRENLALYNRAIEQRRAQYVDPDSGDINIRALALDPDAPLLLFELLRHEGFSRRQCDDMLVAASRSGGSFHSRGIVRTLDHGILRAAVNAPDDAAGADCPVSLDADIDFPVNIRITTHDISEFKPEGSPNVIYIDERALEGTPDWHIRAPRRGDRLAPYGLDGSKLVSDILAAHRFSAAQKRATRLLWRGDTLLWVIGLRASRHWVVTHDTRRYLRLEYQPKLK